MPLDSRKLKTLANRLAALARVRSNVSAANSSTVLTPTDLRLTAGASCGVVAMLVAVCALLVTLATSMKAAAQSIEFHSTWIQQFPAASPPPRNMNGIAYDAAHGQLVVFGGQRNLIPLGDTWTWDGTNWTHRFPAKSPSPRLVTAMTYDIARAQIVLFGGPLNNTFDAPGFTDTWTWNGTNWTKLSPQIHPDTYGVMAYDAAQGESVLFDVNGHTWTWDGTNWTQKFPATSPDSRQYAVMTYDALHGRIVLFGGTDGLGPLNDTWTWDGTNWTQKFPTTSPYISGTPPPIGYDATNDRVVLFGGLRGHIYLDATYTWNGTDWTRRFPVAKPVTRTFAAMTYDGAQGQLVLFGGERYNEEFTFGGELNDTWIYQWGYVNLGSAHICGPQHLPHESCSTSATLHFTISDEQIGSIRYLTEGAPNLDFKKSATAGTCTAKTYGSPGLSCTVNVTFTPTAAGERNGAVVFHSVTGAQLAMIPVYGVGLGPEANFSPVSQTSLGGGFMDPQGLAVDGSRNIYVANTSNNAVKKIPAGCTSSSCVTTLGGGFSEPKSVAVDGGGNVYVADYGNNAVKEIPAGCTSDSCVITVGSGFDGPTGVAVDGRFNIYVADWGNNAVKQMPLICRSANCVTALGGGFNHPYDVALDSKGSIYVADSGNAAVKRIPAGCAATGCVVNLGGGSTNAQGVAVDAAGDVYIAQSDATSIQEIPTGCTYAGCVRTLGDGFDEPAGVALDGGGNLYVADSGDAAVYTLSRAVPSAVSFDATGPGTTSADSPKTVTVENIGNAALTFSLVNFPADFREGPPPNGVQCTTGSSLNPGATCGVSIDFSPPVGSGFGLHSEYVNLVDNAFENFGGTQQIPVSGEVAIQSIRRR